MCGGTASLTRGPIPFGGLSRVCGGTTVTAVNQAYQEGLSPRVRGNPVWSLPAANLTRSIPACAGEPSFNRAATSASRVYPALCGGTYLDHAGNMAGWGLSPRVRGNPTLFPSLREGGGSIPALAGNRGPPWTPLRREPVLSPRVRGNLPD